MQATVHAQIQLAATASQDKALVPRVTHLALKPSASAPLDHLKFPFATMLTIISVADLLLNCSNAAQTFVGKNIRRRGSVDDLLSTTNQVPFDPECATTLARAGPLSAAEVAEFGTASASLHR